jgi:hypothetical protein
MYIPVNQSCDFSPTLTVLTAPFPKIEKAMIIISQIVKVAIIVFFVA